MGAVNMAAPDVNRRRDDFFRRQRVDEKADGGDVGNGVERTDFVKVNLRNGNAVRGAFRVGAAP